ncbi:MAG TPA: hypothetical protein VNS58_13065 [Puia sp.]|nr:hypothetical protein [Puia sp.]
MVTFDLIINPVILLAALIGGVIIGYAANRRKLAKRHARITELESEMMSSHAEVLEMQKAYVQLERKLGEQSSPVISMKINGKETSPKEKVSK